MLVIKAKLKGTNSQYSKLEQAIRTGQFSQNSCLRYWEDNKGVTRNDLQKLCSKLAKNQETPWVNQLNSQARQAHAMASILRQNTRHYRYCCATA